MEQTQSDIYDFSRIHDGPTEPSMMERLRRLKPRKEGDPTPWDEFMAGKTREERLNLRYNSAFVLRPDQMLTQALGYHTFAMFGGRGLGKSTALIYGLMDYIKAGRRNILFVVRTNEDFEKTIVGDGFRKHMDPRCFDRARDFRLNPQRVILPAGGVCGGYVLPHDVEIRVKTSNLDDAIRGFSPDTVIIDEIKTFRNPKAILDQIDYALREWGEMDDDLDDEAALAKMMADKLPKRMVASTPFWDETLLELATSKDTFCRKVTTEANWHNLTPEFRAKMEIQRKTSKGEQEFYGNWLDLTGVQQWARRDFVRFEPRYRPHEDAGRATIYKDTHFEDFQNLFDEFCVGVDPSAIMDEKDEGDDIGLHVAGRLKEKTKDGNPQFVLVENATMRGSPEQWMNRSLDLAEKWNAPTIIYEVQGGQKLGLGLYGTSERLKRMHCRVEPVTAMGRDHAGRAMMVSPLWQQGRVFHAHANPASSTRDPMLDLEEQMLRMSVSEYNGTGSPDATDAMVHCVIWLARLHLKSRRVRVRMSKNAVIY